MMQWLRLMELINRMIKPKIADGFRFQWEEAQKNYVLLYPEGMIKLNHSAGEILFFCDGKKTIEEITAILENKFSTANLLSQVQYFLDYALDKGWVCESCDD